MRVLYVGCNLFGQVPASPEVAFETFTKFDVEELENLVMGHSVLVYRNKTGVVMHGHGFEPRKTHVVTELNVPASRIVDVATSDTRVFLLDDRGELYVLDFLDREVGVKHKPNFARYNRQRKMIRFVAGIGINVAVSDEGRLFLPPEPLGFVNPEIVQICAGNEHCLILDSAGNVYSFGKGSRGQLGHATLTREDEPRQLDALAGLKIIKISCGSWHCCALSADGDVYVWGWSSDGQLGLFDFEEDDEEGRRVETSEKKPVSVIAVPTPLVLCEGDESTKFVGAACGSRHTVLITDQNVVYGCGCNKFNQLGLKQREPIYELTLIDKIEDGEHQFHDIVCGPAATAVLLK